MKLISSLRRNRNSITSGGSSLNSTSANNIILKSSVSQQDSNDNIQNNGGILSNNNENYGDLFDYDDFDNNTTVENIWGGRDVNLPRQQQQQQQQQQKKKNKTTKTTKQQRKKKIHHQQQLLVAASMNGQRCKVLPMMTISEMVEECDDEEEVTDIDDDDDEEEEDEGQVNNDIHGDVDHVIMTNEGVDEDEGQDEDEVVLAATAAWREDITGDVVEVLHDSYVAIDESKAAGGDGGEDKSKVVECTVTSEFEVVASCEEKEHEEEGALSIDEDNRSNNHDRGKVVIGHEEEVSSSPEATSHLFSSHRNVDQICHDDNDDVEEDANHDLSTMAFYTPSNFMKSLRDKYQVGLEGQT
jgi:hypothetical protein